MLRIKPFGVLGVQMTKEKKEVIRGQDPTELDSCCIVDPAGLHHIQPPGGPLGAGGAAGAVYRWVGISQTTEFTENVRKIKKTGDAVYEHYGRFRHGVLDKHVIHAVGPDLRKNPEYKEATLLLSEAYHQIFEQFVLSRKDILRLLPVSSGIFAGDHKTDMPILTMLCMRQGFHWLTLSERKLLANKELHLCIFMEKELSSYRRAAKDQPGSGQGSIEHIIGVYHAFEEAVEDNIVDLGAGPLPFPDYRKKKKKGQGEPEDEEDDEDDVGGKPVLESAEVDIRKRWNSGTLFKKMSSRSSLGFKGSFSGRSPDRYESGSKPPRSSRPNPHRGSSEGRNKVRSPKPLSHIRSTSSRITPPRKS